MLTEIDQLQVNLSEKLDPGLKSQMGQFMTPSKIARYMASLFPASTSDVCRLLDPGAGKGSLSGAFLDRWAEGGFNFQRASVDAFEIDAELRSHLEKSLANYSQRLNISTIIHQDDFIEAAVLSITGDFFGQNYMPFTHAILNPPYKKIGSKSRHRLLLHRAGIETVNLYSAFVSLALALLEPGGWLVAIIPRSFCNGPYYRSFRKFILDNAAIRHLHLFGARNKAFKDDKVLQENVIVMLERDGDQGDVTVSTSTDDSFFDYATCVYPFDRIVFPNDLEKFVHIPTTWKYNPNEFPPAIHYTLTELGITVSTGPVVDFRMRNHIRDMPEPGTIPLLYPGHFTGREIDWPKKDTKKPNAIYRNAETEKWLYPNGYYTVVRRFSSKEEKRRIMASVVYPDAFPNAPALGFENHLNVFHEHKHGLPETLVRGLAVFLNSTMVDDFFRDFNGHTQVNATDLRLMKYPSRDTLSALGKWAQSQHEITQDMIDEQLVNVNWP